jgi:hypothetical protein
MLSSRAESSDNTVSYSQPSKGCAVFSHLGLITSMRLETRACVIVLVAPAAPAPPAPLLRPPLPHPHSLVLLVWLWLHFLVSGGESSASKNIADHCCTLPDVISAAHNTCSALTIQFWVEAMLFSHLHMPLHVVYALVSALFAFAIVAIIRKAPVPCTHFGIPLFVPGQRFRV